MQEFLTLIKDFGIIPLCIGGAYWLGKTLLYFKTAVDSLAIAVRDLQKSMERVVIVEEKANKAHSRIDVAEIKIEDHKEKLQQLFDFHNRKNAD